MKRDSVAYLVGGLAFGVLLGYALFHAIEHRPGAGTEVVSSADIPSPAGPMAPTEGGRPPGPSGGEQGTAPMMAEVTRLREAVARDPGDETSWVRLANIYQDVGMYPQAIEHYEKALAAGGTSADVLTDLGICYQGMQQFDRALELFGRAQEVDPSHWQSLYNTVVVTGLNLGRVEEARAALGRLERVRPDAPHLDELREALRQRAGGAPQGAS